MATQGDSSTGGVPIQVNLKLPASGNGEQAPRVVACVFAGSGHFMGDPGVRNGQE